MIVVAIKMFVSFTVLTLLFSIGEPGQARVSAYDIKPQNRLLPPLALLPPKKKMGANSGRPSFVLFEIRRLKVEFARHDQNSAGNESALARAVDADRRALRAGDLAERGRRGGPAGLCEVRVVQGVVCRRAQLEVCPLGDPYALGQLGIDVEVPRTVEAIRWNVAVVVLRGEAAVRQCAARRC